MSILKVYFKGTGLAFPYIMSIEDIKIHLEKGFQKYISSDEHIASPTENIEFIYNQTSFFEETLCKCSKNGFMGEKQQKKAAELLGFDTVESLITMWFMNINYLLKMGRIEDDNNFGFCGIMSPSITTEELATYLNEHAQNKYQARKICNLCQAPSKNKCSRCENIYYCCREHQLSDWKEHKKVCIVKSV